MGEKADVLAMVRGAKRTLTAADNSLAAGRCLAPVAIALSLVDAHEEDAWLVAARDTVYANFGSIVYPGRAAAKANNHGSASDMSVIAIDAHVRDIAHLEKRAIPVWRTRLGDHGQTVDGAPVKLTFGSSLQVDPAGPVVVGRPGTTHDGVNLDGLLLEEQRRGGDFPNCGNYNFGAAGQFLVSARILMSHGYPVESWGDNAVRRIFEALRRAGCQPVGDDRWQGSMVSAMFGSGLISEGVGDGKSFCCTDYLFPLSPLSPLAPVARFTATPVTGVAPLTVSFADTSRNGPTSWSWSFGDGEGSRTQHPTHTFAEPGTYAVRLVASNALGSDRETTSIVAVRPRANAVPSCADLRVTVVEDRGEDVAPRCTDADAGDLLTYEIAAAAANGVASVTPSGNLQYVPSPGESGTDSFTYIASDRSSTSTEATVSVTIAANAIPSCDRGALTVVADHSGGEVTPSCTDGNGDRLAYAIAGQGRLGVASVTTSGLHYLPNPGQSGSDSFSYTATDGTATSAPKTVSVTIRSNGTPVCAPRSLTVTHAAHGADVAPACTDAELDPVMYAIASQGTRGVASVTPIGTLRYVPDAGQSGTDSFTYSASDASTTSAQATVTVVIRPTNVAPACSPRSLTVAQDSTAGADVAPSCTDADAGDVLTYAIAAQGSRGVASVNVGGQLHYVPSPGQSGSDSFTYTANDGDASSAPATVSVTITPASSTTVTLTPVADTFVSSAAPNANNGAATTLSTRGGGTQINSYLRFTVSGVGSTSRAILRLWISDASPDAGKLHRLASNTWPENLRYANRPPPGALITDLGAVSTGAYRDIDVSAYVTGDGTYSFTILGENNNAAGFHSREGANDPQLVVTPGAGGGNVAPACSPRSLSVAQDSTAGADVAPSCTDADAGDVLTYAIAAQGSRGVASVNVGGQLHYVPSPGQSGSDSFTYTANDGDASSAPATVSVTITPASSTTVTLTPVADTFVSSAAPNANNGAATTLSTRGGGTQINSYLRFTVSGVGSTSRAILRLWISDASPDAGKLHRLASNTWPENLRYANRPPPGALITDLGAVSTGAYRDIDVSAYVTGDGTYSFTILGENNNAAGFHSREGANDPQLVVTPQQPQGGGITLAAHSSERRARPG